MCRTPVVAAVDYAIASPLKGEGCPATAGHHPLLTTLNILPSPLGA